MNKNIKIILSLLFVIGIILVPFKDVKAYSIDLDPNSNIEFPSLISNGEGTITLTDVEQEYHLYYQAIEINSAEYNNLKEEMTKLENEATEVIQLGDECENLKTIYEEAQQAYDAKLETGEEDDELTALEEALNTAKSNYQIKLEEYTTRLEEIRTRYEEMSTKEEEVIPVFVEENWVETETGTFSIDLSQFSKEKVFVVWAKLELSDKTIVYDRQIYTMTGNKVDEDTDIDQGLENTNTPNENTIINTSNTNDSTTASGRLPFAGTSMMISVSALVLIILAIIFYKKYNNYKDIK